MSLDSYISVHFAFLFYVIVFCGFTFVLYLLSNICVVPLFNKLVSLLTRYLNAIQTSAPHLLRYLATAFIVNKRRRPQFKDFIKVIQLEQYSYKDPITEFLACVYVNYDFDGAQRKMRECEEVSFLFLDATQSMIFPIDILCCKLLAWSSIIFF